MTSASGPTAAWRSGTQGGDLLPSGPAGRLPTPAGDGHGPEAGPPTVTIGSYPDYPTAQRVVDYLADNRFPVEHSAIVGTNLTLVETVLGRMTTGRAGLLGAGTGAWFGLFIGLLFGIFTVGNWLAVMQEWEPAIPAHRPWRRRQAGGSPAVIGFMKAQP